LSEVPRAGRKRLSRVRRCHAVAQHDAWGGKGGRPTHCGGGSGGGEEDQGR